MAPMVIITAAVTTATPSELSAPHVISTGMIMGWGFAIISGLIIVLGYFLRSQLEAILQAQKENRDRQIECRETLPTRFADKRETQSALHGLYARTDRHESALTRHEAILYARGMTPPDSFQGRVDEEK